MQLYIRLKIPLKSKLYFIWFLSILFSCGDASEHTNRTVKKLFSKNPEKTTQVIVQAFDGISDVHILETKNQLSKYFSKVEVNPSTPLPIGAFNKQRNRYRADSLLRFLDNSASNEAITIGITTKDISTTKGKYSDWGVMGLAYRPGRVCVVSTFRLKKKSLSSQLFKVCIHELGHTQGLRHCKVKSCFMRDAEGGNPLHEETGFCARCKGFLLKKGWKI